MEKPRFDFGDFRLEGEAFLRRLVERLEALGVPAKSFRSDHLCFRVATFGEYERYREELARHGKFLTEAPVNGRPICTFRLDEPFRTENHLVELVELPAPKECVSYSTGFEHAEFLINEAFERFAGRFSNLSWTVAGTKFLNPELCLKVDAMQAKFHLLPLDRVIEIESAAIEDIIFDLDGTLVESREIIHEINKIVFSEATGRQVSREESVAKFHPEFSKLFDAFDISCSEKRSRAITRWGEVSSGFSYKLFDGVKELVERLASLGFRLHLWTARDEASAREILADIGLAGVFSTLSFADERFSKPHAGSLRFDWESARTNRVIMVGDSPSDIRGARNIRAVSAAALWDSSARGDHLIAAGAELFFHSIDQLEEWLVARAKSDS